MYDYLIVGAGLFGAVFARQATDAGKKVLVIDRRSHIGGNVYTEEREGINIHVYGAHIFHTNNKRIWDYVNRFTNAPVTNYKGEIYSLLFNMYTFNKMWDVVTPEEAAAGITRPKNLEEQAISLVARTFMKRSLRATRKSSGADPATSCRHLLSSGFRCA